MLKTLDYTKTVCKKLVIVRKRYLIHRVYIFFYDDYIIVSLIDNTDKNIVISKRIKFLEMTDKNFYDFAENFKQFLFLYEKIFCNCI